MPLSRADRRFLQSVSRLKIYLLVMGICVLTYLLVLPAGEIEMGTAVLGVILCGVFWLTQRLLAFITLLDFELTRLMSAVKRSLPPEHHQPFV